MAPQFGAADADECTDRRCESDCVVRVNDALTQAEDESAHDQRAAPQHSCSAQLAGTDLTTTQPERTEHGDQRGRNQPRDLRAHRRPEKPGNAGRAPHAPAAGTSSRRCGASCCSTAAGNAARLVAGQPAEAVVAEDEFKNAVVLRAADVRPGTRRRQRHRDNPPGGGDEHRNTGEEQLPDPTPKRCRCGKQVHKAERGDDEERLHHLGQESQAHKRSRQHEPASARSLQCPRHRVGGNREQQHEQCVRVVEAEHQHGDRCEREYRAGE